MRSKPLALAALAALAILSVAAAVSLFFFAQKRAAQRAEQDSRTVVEAVRKVARLTTVEMNVSSFQLRRDSKDLLGFIPIKCEKTVAILYRGRVAAGFDLKDRDAVSVTVTHASAAHKLLVELPAPQLLYVDAPPPHVVVADGSVCNRFEPADYEKLHGEARAAAQAEALQKGILLQAEQHARELVEAVGGSLGYAVEVRTRTPALSVIRAD